jgi:hypothetical protein
VPSPQLSDGLIILVVRVRDEIVREQVIHRLNDVGEQITKNIYELNIGDWDAGLWEDEVQNLERLLEGTRDRLLVWKFTGQTFVRFSISGSA